MTEHIKQLAELKADAASKVLAVSCLDYTSLNDNDTEESIETLCANATTALGNVAAVCVFPKFVGLAKALLADTDIKVATVVNFPEGNAPLDEVVQQTQYAIADGADEIDMVLPYQTYLDGDSKAALTYVSAVKHFCENKKLKVILETGLIEDPQIIYQMSMDVLHAGADFIKTSTGKVATGATLTAAYTMLTAIKNFQQHSDRAVGFKASGGVRTADQAAQYIALGRAILGADWPNPSTFRLGASSLLNALLDQANTANDASY